MKLIIDIPEEAYKQIIDFGFLEKTHGKICYKAIKNSTPIPDNATNGEVINALFNAETSSDIEVCSTEYWWDALYQKGGRE